MGFKISYSKACERRYDGVNTPKWIFEIEPFVVQ
jgi:hypothetical protein